MAMYLFSRILSRLVFLLRSTNQHGVHSPFVFKYLTQCLYEKGYRNRTKFQQIALKSIPYFEYRSIYIPAETGLKTILKEAYPGLVFGKAPYDLIAFEKRQVLDIDLEELAPLCHNDSAILIEGIRDTPGGLAAWELLCTDPRVTVSIDFYYGGILFFRKEQEKQHFRIRI